MRCRFALGAVVTLMLATPLVAQERSAPLVLRLPTSAWALALGNGVTAGRATSEMLFHNPSALTLSVGSAVSAQRWGGAATAASLAHAVVSSNWGIGFGVRYLDYGAAGATITHPTELGTAGPELASSLAATVGVSRVVRGVRLGVAATYAEERHPADRDGVGVLDLGAGRDVGIFAVGVALRNLGPDRVLGTAAYATPLRGTLGVALRPRAIGTFFDAAAMAEVGVARDGRIDGSVGGELLWVPLEGWAIATRLGFRTVESIGESGGRPFTAGFGVSLDRFTLDYALDPARNAGTSHRIGIRMR